MIHGAPTSREPLLGVCRAAWVGPTRQERRWGRLLVRTGLVELAGTDSGCERGPCRAWVNVNAWAGRILTVPHRRTARTVGYFDAGSLAIAAGRLPPHGGSRVTTHRCLSSPYS